MIDDHGFHLQQTPFININNNSNNKNNDDAVFLKKEVTFDNTNQFCS